MYGIGAAFMVTELDEGVVGETTADYRNTWSAIAHRLALCTNIDHRFLTNPVHFALSFATILAILPKITATVVAVEKFCKWFKGVWSGKQKKRA